MTMRRSHEKQTLQQPTQQPVSATTGAPIQYDTFTEGFAAMLARQVSAAEAAHRAAVAANPAARAAAGHHAAAAPRRTAAQHAAEHVTAAQTADGQDYDAPGTFTVNRETGERTYTDHLGVTGGASKYDKGSLAGETTRAGIRIAGSGPAPSINADTAAGAQQK